MKPTSAVVYSAVVYVVFFFCFFLYIVFCYKNYFIEFFLNGISSVPTTTNKRTIFVVVRKEGLVGPVNDLMRRRATLLRVRNSFGNASKMQAIFVAVGKTNTTRYEKKMSQLPFVTLSLFCSFFSFLSFFGFFFPSSFLFLNAGSHCKYFIIVFGHRF